MLMSLKDTMNKAAAAAGMWCTAPISTCMLMKQYTVCNNNNWKAHGYMVRQGDTLASQFPSQVNCDENGLASASLISSSPSNHIKMGRRRRTTPG